MTLRNPQTGSIILNLKFHIRYTIYTPNYSSSYLHYNIFYSSNPFLIYKTTKQGNSHCNKSKIILSQVLTEYNSLNIMKTPPYSYNQASLSYIKLKNHTYHLAYHPKTFTH
ncbi:hypothetical protein V8G54_005481 [Vigna mungo]|uniref:Uncharacterized protein n=1 Tax=Vigna mungo TaxID=3915 RepID=A0AAQ3S3S7_VIGMU